MPSQQVAVVVRDSGTVVDGPVARPVRLLPDGRAGVVYGGAVYPLRKGDVVDLADEPVDKWLCPTFVQQGVAVPYAEQRKESRRAPLLQRWAVETNKHGHYLVFDGSERTAEAVVAALEAAGLPVRRWDSSHRPASDGVHYDWFARLAFTGERDECLDRLGALLSAPGAGAQEAAAVTSLAERHEQVELARLREAAASLDTELAAARAQARRSQQEAKQRQGDLDAAKTALAASEDARQELARKVLQARDKERSSRDELKTLARALDEERSARGAGWEVHGAELEASVAARTAAENEWYAAEEEAERLAEENARLRGRVQDLELVSSRLASEVEALTGSAEEQAAEARESAVVRTARSGRRRDSVSSFLTRLLPRLDLDDDAVEVLLSFAAPLKTLKVLIQLQEEDTTLARTRIKGQDGLWEVDEHLTTGDGAFAAGRVYVRSPQGGRLAVHLHRKKDDKEQVRFLRGLGRSA